MTHSAKDAASVRPVPPALLCALLCVFGFLVTAEGQQARQEPPLKIVYSSNPPLHFKNHLGQPDGFAVDVIREAARRTGIQLQWELQTNGLVWDLKAVMSLRPGQITNIYISKPFLQSKAVFVVRADSRYQTLADLASARVTYLDFAIHRQNLEKLGLSTFKIPKPTASEALAEVDEGRADAAFLDQYAANWAVVSTTKHNSMRLIPTGLPFSQMGIAARPELSQTADLLRQGISQMVEDHSIATLTEKWGFTSSLTGDMISELVRAQRRERLMMFACITAAFATAIAFGFFIRSQMAADRLRATNKKLELLMNTIPDCIFTVSSDGVVEQSQYTGSNDPGPGQGRLRCVDLTEPLRNEIIAELRQNGRCAPRNHEVVNPDGSVDWFHVAALPLNEDHFLFVVRDVSELKKSMELNKRYQESLHQAQKMESIGQLAGGVAHDFNNVLGAIIMGVECIKFDDGLSEDSRATLQDIEDTAKRAASLTRQLLSFSRRHALDKRMVNLEELIESTCRLLEPTLGSRVEFKTTCSTPDLVAEVDYGQIEQVIMNICINARDAMPDGGVLHLDLGSVDNLPPGCTVDRSDHASGYVQITISDSGCGMDEALMKRIFEPFFTTKPVGRGNGLGLATAYGIVKEHGGCIQVESRIGQGSTFRIFLPNLPGAKAIGKVTTPAERSMGRRILYVEDKPSLRRCVAQMLIRHGHEVWEADDSVSALQLWEQVRDRCDLVLTDVNLPGGLNGYELTAQFMMEKHDLQVVVCSGYNKESAGGVAEVTDNLTFVPKPFTLPQLLSAIDDLSRNRTEKPADKNVQVFNKNAEEGMA